MKFSKEYQPKEKWTEEKAIKLGKELLVWLKETDEDNEDKGNMFFEEFLIIEKNLYPDLIRYLSEKFISFYELIVKAKKIQEIKLVKYGVGDRLNASMTKFVLINHFKYTNGTNEITGADGKELVKINIKMNDD